MPWLCALGSTLGSPTHSTGCLAGITGNLATTLWSCLSLLSCNRRTIIETTAVTVGLFTAVIKTPLVACAMPAAVLGADAAHEFKFCEWY